MKSTILRLSEALECFDENSAEDATELQSAAAEALGVLKSCGVWNMTAVMRDMARLAAASGYDPDLIGADWGDNGSA